MDLHKSAISSLICFSVLLMTDSDLFYLDYDAPKTLSAKLNRNDSKSSVFYGKSFYYGIAFVEIWIYNSQIMEMNRCCQGPLWCFQICPICVHLPITNLHNSHPFLVVHTAVWQETSTSVRFSSTTTWRSATSSVLYTWTLLQDCYCVSTRPLEVYFLRNAQWFHPS